MKSLNQVQLIGNLGEEPEMRYTPAGKMVTTFSMATTRKFKDESGELKDDTCWHRCVAWEKLAEISNNILSKGSYVFVQGRINNRSWTDTHGAKHYASEIVCDDVILLEKREKVEELPAPVAEELPAAAAVASSPTEAPKEADKVPLPLIP